MNSLAQSNNKNGDKNPVVKATVRAMEIHSGPIPSASELAKYENVLPGAANRILEMAEKQSQHRQKLETKMLEANIKSEHAGQIFGFVIFGLAILAGFVLLILGKDVVGLASLIVSAGSIVGLFVYKRIDEKKELKTKNPRERTE